MIGQNRKAFEDMTNNPHQRGMLTGIAWYTRDDYQRCMALFDDADELNDTYDEWFAIAGKNERDMAQAGERTFRAYIDPDTFPKWCADNGFTKIDKTARMAYANWKAAEASGIRPPN